MTALILICCSTSVQPKITKITDFENSALIQDMYLQSQK